MFFDKIKPPAVPVVGREEGLNYLNTLCDLSEGDSKGGDPFIAAGRLSLYLGACATYSIVLKLLAFTTLIVVRLVGVSFLQKYLFGVHIYT